MLRDLVVTFAPGVVSALLMLSSCELGFRVGRRAKAFSDDTMRTEFFTIQAATLALLSLLLSFSFSIGAGALSNRKQVVLNEASVIASAHQAAQLLPAPSGREIRALLIRYVDTRLNLYRGDLLDEGTVHQRLAESEKLRDTIWDRATAAAEENPQSVPVGIALEALAQLRQLNPKRIAALTSSVPPAMLYALGVTAFIAMGWVGCSIGLSARRSWLIPLVIALPFALIITLIMDLDNPRHGLVRVTERSLTDLKRALAADVHN